MTRGEEELSGRFIFEVGIVWDRWDGIGWLGKG